MIFNVLILVVVDFVTWKTEELKRITAMAVAVGNVPFCEIVIQLSVSVVYASTLSQLSMSVGLVECQLTPEPCAFLQ